MTAVLTITPNTETQVHECSLVFKTIRLFNFLALSFMLSHIQRIFHSSLLKFLPNTATYLILYFACPSVTASSPLPQLQQVFSPFLLSRELRSGYLLLSIRYQNVFIHQSG